ncbi:hypothetical protein [Pseudoxanthomonas sacheonensis]|uniref:Uncharacterized protein n=1 Tax=Pseudoxanthomonas sacheonensis TaxID=443615 RepID=A0ABU1RQH6_9GAMM|nr:hypothetical protein [Pseudoxanthomonas sacheonensis]MDR6841007.1 hypothetical protein [Pseudoxanthomonas sacheonensis]
MMMPTGSWFTIASYWDFHDFPRFILATDQESKFWILDCGFDDELDDYSANYDVYFVGRELEQARAACELHAKGTKGSAVGVVHNTQLEFDPTKRQKFLLVDKC